MDRLSTAINNGVVFVSPEGRIDSSNARAVEADIFAALEGREGSSVVLDCSKLSYVSSAGLRIILRLKKQFPSLEIRETSPEVYDVLEMTGFTEMMTVKRALRRLSVEGKELIGKGANGAVYRLDPETIVKVYFDSDALAEIDRERDLARRAFVLGVPTAIPYDVVRVGEGYGSVFELLDARSIADVLKEDPSKLSELVPIYVGVLRKLHSAKLTPGEIPPANRKLLRAPELFKTVLSEEKADKLVRLIREVPDDGTLIHGDYHVKNVMLMDGEGFLIDMDTLSTGHPVFEFGNMFASYRGFNEPDLSRNDAFFGIPHSLSCELFDRSLKLFFEGRERSELEDITRKVMTAGYARVLSHALFCRETGDAFTGRVIENCVKHLDELIDKVDSLYYEV